MKIQKIRDEEEYLEFLIEPTGKKAWIWKNDVPNPRFFFYEGNPCKEVEVKRALIRQFPETKKFLVAFGL